ncbi:hypothetical protein DFP73DRAFT_523235 [Morchella snyderi]|nr:hypothetical protein DFP73DRAFT_523235 [Morchella snyderi]
MNRPSRPEDLQLQKSSTSTRARSRSIGSMDKPLSSNSSSIYSLTNPLTKITPEPAYIAASAATGIVTGNHEGFLHDEGNAGHATATIPVTPASLKLINQFLDFLLYSFLSASKSTSLKALRPAVSEVLRNRLAKEAVAGADQELSSYLGGGDDGDDFDGLNEAPEIGAEWDLETAWKKTRLRCMVYSSLGDIEEEDEEIYLGYGNLEGIVGSQQYEQNSIVPGVVSPAVAIWLTAVLEFMGEQTLLLAGHAAINRFTQRIAAIESGGFQLDTTERERPMVEELDTEKVALNSSLGRLWRQWRKRVRGRGSSFSSPGPHGGILQRLERTASRMSSRSTLTDPRNTQSEASEIREEITGIEGRELGTNVENQLKKTSISTEKEIVKSINTPSNLGAGHNYLFYEDSPRRRPQSLVLFPSTTTEAPFVLSQSIKRHSSLPTIIRSEFPDPVVEDTPEAKDTETDFEDIDGEFYTPAEEELNSGGSVQVVRPASEQLNPLGKSYFPTQEQPERSAVQGIAEFKHLNEEAEALKKIPAPDDGVSELTFFTQATDDEDDGEDDHHSVIGSAHTSDIQVQPSTSQTPSSPLHKSGDHSDHPENVTPKFERFTPSSSRRPAELVEIRTNGRVSTFQEQRAADRRPSATTLAESIDSDDESPTTTAHKYFVEGGRLTPGGTNQISGEYFAHAKKTSSASSKYSQHSQLSDRKLGQLTLIQPPGSTVSLPSERGNVRAWTPPQTPNKSRRSSSSGKAQRPVTSHSGTSQNSTKLKCLIAWPMESGKQSRESDDESRSSLHSERPSTKLASLDDKERSFEELISSGDTIHCTITPDPLRRMESKEVQTPRTATSALADFLRNTGPDGKEVRAVPPSRSGNSSRPSTARAIPIIPKDPSLEDVASLTQLLRSTSASPSETRPQTPTTSLPSSSHNSTYSPASRRMYGPSSVTASPKAGNESTPLNPGGITGIPSVIRQYRSDSLGSRPKNRLVARHASGFTTSDSTSALADFFRNTTPPIDVDGQVTQRRISRSVAPFRNTMDSDQFELPEAESEPAVNNTTPPNELNFLTSAAVPPDSHQSSFSSSTALLRNNSKKQHDYGAVNSMPETKRKQTRIKDPYAIDMDDEEDDEDMEALNLIIPKKRKEDESFMDFLLNAPPPPQPPTPPQENEEMRTVQKKNSSVSLIGRFGRNGRKNSIASNADKFPLPPLPQMPGGYKHTPLAHEDDSSSRYMQGEEQRRTLYDSWTDMDSPSTANHARFGNRTQVRGGVQARGARTDRGETDTLADFLKYSEPPPAPAQRALTPKEDTSAMAKFKNFTFLRKSKRNEIF